MIHTDYTRQKACFFILLFLITCNILVNGQDSLRHKVYTVNPYIDIPITTVGAVTAIWGLNTVNRKPPLDSLTIIHLDANNINRFDRSATKQNAAYASGARTLSDYGMALSFSLPFLLMFDKEIRADWAPLLLLYLESQAINGNLYSWGAAFNVDRIRPLVYNPQVPWSERTGKRTKNSFYSGHTSSSATASFFMAKVYCDYHPELGNNKYFIYSLALIPPIYTGIFRYVGMKHFPTDVITGLTIGAATGILIPFVHKRTPSGLTVIPFAGEVNGFALSYNF